MYLESRLKQNDPGACAKVAKYKKRYIARKSY